jgi:aryl-alcohol dehydrogenase-like predicted oxidoreductase
VILLGATTTGQLDSNLRALDLALAPGDLEELEPLRTAPEEYWSQRSRLPWN